MSHEEICRFSQAVRAEWRHSIPELQFARPPTPIAGLPHGSGACLSPPRLSASFKLSHAPAACEGGLGPGVESRDAEGYVVWLHFFREKSGAGEQSGGNHLLPAVNKGKKIRNLSCGS